MLPHCPALLSFCSVTHCWPRPTVIFWVNKINDDVDDDDDDDKQSF